MDFAQLKTAIQDYCQSSETSFVANLNNFIIAAEDRIFAVIDMPSAWEDDDGLRLIDGNAEYELGGALTVGDAGVINVLSVRLSENASAADQLSGVEFGPVRYLLQKDYDFLLEAYPGSNSASTKGVPSYYGISKASTYTGNPTLTIRVGPIPDDTYQMTVTYSQKTAAQSITGQGSETATTWLSVTFPDILLYGSLVQAYTYLKGEPDIIQLYEKQFMEGMALLKNVSSTRMDNDSYRVPFDSPVQRGN